MRLQRVWIRGYKRFSDPVEIYADGKLTAIVGPNEAGKTSLLEALAHLSSDEPFRGGEEPPTISRGANPADKDLIVEALFRLEQSDISEVTSIEGGEDLRWFYLGRRTNGELALRVEPEPRRDLRSRAQTDNVLTRLEGSRWMQSLEQTEADLLFSSIERGHEILCRRRLNTEHLSPVENCAVPRNLNS